MQGDYQADLKGSPSDAGITILDSNDLDLSRIASIPPLAEGVSSPSLAFPLATKEADSNPLYSRFFRPNYHQRCKEGFFQYFYDAHPFLPPRDQLLQVLKTNPMDHLRIAMCYVGSRYVPGSDTASYALEFDKYLTTTSAGLKDASMVQAMLLFALGLDGNNDQKRAVEILIKAQNLAVEIGMNQREYAVVNGRGSPICEESLSRTWWELYIVSVMVAGFHGRETFHLRDIVSNVPLPCEEKEFASGCITQLHTIEEFDDETFCDEEICWSSYTYRIAAARNLDRILQSTQILFLDDPAIYQLEAYLTNWHLHLPQSKRVLFDQFGTFDEMLFQAHMITNVSSILLHQQFSALEGFAVQTITSCTGQSRLGLGLTSDNIHTARATQAASSISKLVTLPGSLLKHTHFFVCALTLSSISHLSLWSSLPIMASDQDLRQQIRMNAGALRAVAHIFPSSGIGFRQVTTVAQKIYTNRKNAVGDVFWRDFIDEDFMACLIENTATIDG